MEEDILTLEEVTELMQSILDRLKQEENFNNLFQKAANSYGRSK